MNAMDKFIENSETFCCRRCYIDLTEVNGLLDLVRLGKVELVVS